ncbi:UDP-N-acetylmuramoyl-tripeptide--D-alanyl-D-alanine ligase [Actinoplanes sp. NPDC049265]|uniref:UDP-N-acetylmuramoyl-tripeptide--D-alanyl-D- alanine ligase n=1 Tax=Actinoplanes sp. NPDC049265 TaxID=3363902 RepID=UPI00371B3374
MIPLTLGEIATITGGRLVNAAPDTLVDGPVEFDNRRTLTGGLFVAFDGEKVDGHSFAGAAVAAGAAGVLGARDTGQPGVVVDDQIEALARLARHSVDRLPGLTVVGVTASSGKTTTKDFIGQLLSRLGETIAPPGSLNNELGFPYTALKATASTRFLVLEMGARNVGHIRHLAEIAPPKIGAVLNVGAAHIGKFGSIEQTALAKGELIEALPADGVAVLNADDPLVSAMATRTQARVVFFSESDVAGIRVDERDRASFTLDGHPVHLKVSGRHQVSNTLAAAAVAVAAGMPVADAAAALSEVTIRSERRMDVFDRPDGVTVIDDTYNANTSSTVAALRSLATLGAGRRTVAVLGYMAELGDQEDAGHREVGRLAAELGVDRLIAVSEEARPVLDGAAEVPGWTGTAEFAADQPAAIALLRPEPGDVFLVKASRYRTWDVVDALRPEGVRP